VGRVAGWCDPRPHMKLVFTSSEVPELEMIRHMLEDAGVHCEIRSSTALDAPGAKSSSAELWVDRDDDYPRARDLFESWTKPAPHASPTWICPHCHARLAELFDICWKCGTHRACGC
jgi:hypothetical protein